MPIVIPLRPNLPSYDEQIQLDGVLYTLQVKWNVRYSTWFLTVLDGNADTVLVGGKAIRANFPLAPYTTARQPPGAQVPVDTSQQGLDPVLTDLGTRVHLLYFTAAELGLPQ